MICLILYAFCILTLYLKILPGFILSWFAATFMGVSACRNTASALFTLALSFILLMMGSMVLRVEK
jgi:hypothetical protein